MSRVARNEISIVYINKVFIQSRCQWRVLSQVPCTCLCHTIGGAVFDTNLGPDWSSKNTRHGGCEQCRIFEGVIFMKVHWLIYSYTYKYIYINIYGCFQKIGNPQIIHFNRVFHCKPSILGYPIFGNTHIYIYYGIHMSIFEEIFWAKLQVQDEHHWSLQFAASRSHPFDSPPPRRESSFYPAG